MNADVSDDSGAPCYKGSKFIAFAFLDCPWPLLPPRAPWWWWPSPSASPPPFRCWCWWRA